MLWDLFNKENRFIQLLFNKMNKFVLFKKLKFVLKCISFLLEINFRFL